MAENKIPAPSKETQSSWQRLGPGNYNLIFDTEKKEWRVIKRGDLKPNQISYVIDTR